MTNQRDAPSPERIGEGIGEIVRDIDAMEPPPDWGWKGSLAECFGMSGGNLSKYLRTPPPRSSERAMVDISNRIGLDLGFFFLDSEEVDQEARRHGWNGEIPRWHFFLYRRESPNREGLERIEETIAMVDGYVATDAPMAKRLDAVKKLAQALVKLKAVAHASTIRELTDEQLAKRLADTAELRPLWLFLEEARSFARDLEYGVRRVQPSHADAFDAIARVKYRRPRDWVVEPPR